MKKIIFILLFLFWFISNVGADNYTRKTTWVTSDLITASKLNADPDEAARILGTNSNGLISNGNVKSTADITENKILFSAVSGHDHDGIGSKGLANNTVASANIVDDTIINADINSSADIVSSKIAFSVSGWDIDGTTVTSSATELNLLTGETALLTDGSSAGGDLAGTYPNPTVVSIIKRASYFEPDSSCVVAFNHGSLALDLSPLHNAISLTSLAEADLVVGLVSPQCYDYDNANDYATIATHALQAGMAAVTMEAVVNRDTAGVEDFIIHTVTDGFLKLSMTDTNIKATIITGSGTEAVDVAHGLSGNGIDQTVHIIIAWNNAGVAEAYVNGADVGDGDNAGNGTVSDSANGINIGADSNNANLFPGKIDGARILRRKMGATEVLARYNAFQ